MFNSYVNVYQRLHLHFPMGFPMVFPFSQGFFYGFPMFLWFSHVPMVFPWFSHGFPTGFPCSRSFDCRPSVVTRTERNSTPVTWWWNRGKRAMRGGCSACDLSIFFFKVIIYNLNRSIYMNYRIHLCIIYVYLFIIYYLCKSIYQTIYLCIYLCI